MLFIIFLLACGGITDANNTSSATIQPLGLGSAANAVSLHTSEAQYQLPEPNWEALGVDPSAIGSWTVEPVLLARQPRHTSPAYELPLPFQLVGDEKGFRPMGLEVSINGTNVPFARTPTGRSKTPCWKVQGQRLHLTYPGDMPPREVAVHYPRVAKQLARLGSDPANIPAKRTINGRTLDGVALPIGGSGQWKLAVPTGQAELSAQLALEPSMLSKLTPQKATLRLSIARTGESDTVVQETAILPGDSGFQTWRVPLVEWAGETVTLTLEAASENDASATADRVFIGAPVLHGDAIKTPRRVVLIGLDTLRADKVLGSGRAVATPGFDRFAEEAVRFERSWTPAPRTRPSFRASTTGRLPLLAVGAENLGETFQRNGWATAGIVANVHLQPRFSFDQGFDTWHFAGDRDADLQVDEAMGWLKENTDRDAFLFLHFMDPHLPYRAPEPFKNRFVTDPDPSMPEKFNRGQVLEWQKRDMLPPKRKAHIEGRHDGEIAYLDQALNTLLNELDALPGETLVVLHNDHGEEFWDHGGFEHNHTLHEELVRGIMWFRPTAGLTQGRASQTPATLADIAPTLHTLAHLDSPPETDGMDLSPWLNDPSRSQDWTRPLPLGYLQYGHDRWAVIWNDHKYILHTGTGREELYDLGRDPLESEDIASSSDTAPYLSQLVTAHQLDPANAGPGLRLRINGNELLQDVALTLPNTCNKAGLFDPELLVERRANLEWGETAKRLVSDIGSLTLSDDGKTVRYRAGVSPQGTVWIRCDQSPAMETVEININGETLGGKRKGRGLRFASTTGTFELLPGPVLVPPPGEFERMQATQQQTGPDEDDIALLESLGYVGHTEDE